MSTCFIINEPEQQAAIIEKARYAGASSDITFLFVLEKSADEKKQIIKNLAPQKVFFLDGKNIEPAALHNNVLKSFYCYQFLKEANFSRIYASLRGGILHHSLQAKQQGLAFADTEFSLLKEKNTDAVLAENFQHPTNIEQLASSYQEQQVEKNINVKFPLKNTAQPLISLCLIHYNRPQFLQQALASITQQTYKNFEVILLDDGSSNSAALKFLQELEDDFKIHSWRIIRQENLYLGAARNNAARQARGEYLFFMDDDNIAKPHELEVFVQVAVNTGADVLTCCVQPFSGNLPAAVENLHPQVYVPYGVDAALGLLTNSFGDANCLIKKSVFEQLGGFTEDRGIGHEDWEFFSKALLSGYKFVLIPEVLFYYRVQAQGMLQSGNRYKNLQRNLRPYLQKYPELGGAIKLLHGLIEKKN